MAISTRSRNQQGRNNGGDDPPQGANNAPPANNPVPDAQEILQTMQQLVAQNQQVLQLILAGQQVGAQAQAVGAQARGAQAPNGAPNNAPNDAPLGDGANPGAPPPPALYGDLQENEGDNRSVDHESHFGDDTNRAPNLWDEKIREVQNQLGNVFNAMRGQGPEAIDYLVRRTDTPFIPNVANYPLPPKFKMPSIETFDGRKDPLDHLETYKSLMQLHNVPDEIMCRAFPTTLKGSARQWFANLPPASISSFTELSRSFVSHFIGGRRHQKPATHLLSIKQDRDESLRSYLARFNEEVLQVEEPDEKVTMTAFLGGLRPSGFLFSVMKRPPKSMPELLAKAQKYMNAEDITRARRGESSQTGEKRNERDRDDKESGNKRGRTDRVSAKDRLGPALPRERPIFTPLNTTVGHILMQIQNDPAIKWPGKMRAPPNQRNQNKYCRFHRDHGHDTDECYDLKRQIEELIQRGHLRQYVADQGRAPPPPPRNQEGQQLLGEIRTISGGLAGGGESLSAMKAHARKARHNDCIDDQRPPKIHRPASSEVISFSDKDLEGIHHPHDDPLVLTVTIANFQVRRVLVDNGSSADIMFAEVYDKLSLGREKLQPIRSPLIGFSGEKVYPLGCITLPITVGVVPRNSTAMVNFIVMDCPTAYNVILGRPALNTLRAVPSTYHLVLRFPTPNGIGEVRGDQTTARECYISSVKAKKRETLPAEVIYPRDDTTLESHSQ